MTSARPASGPHVLRRMNRCAVLAAVRSAAAPVSIALLIETTGLSRPAVTRALSDLAGLGVVERLDAGPPPGNIGRPAQQVRFRAELGFVAGLDIGTHGVHVVLADLLGRKIAELQADAAPLGTDVVDTAADAIQRCAASAGLDPGGLWAIAVGTPGVVDTETGEIRVAPSIPGWAGVPVVETLSRRHGCPVLIDNDMNFAALAEQSHGAARGIDNFIYVYWDERVGAGIVIGGRPYRGASSAAGELGFIDLAGDLDRTPGRSDGAPPDGAGSFERLVGAKAVRDLALAACTDRGAGELYEAVRDTALDRVGPMLFSRADTGDAVAAAICDQVVARFSAGLAILIMLIDPGAVILGGSMSQSGEPLLRRLRHSVQVRLFNPPRLVLSPLREQAVALGAIEDALTTAEKHLMRLCTE
ncbi:ROK family transcriptional regulator [Streptomyces sp. NPDC058045]|uniref:ROK family transcriptional regulator n=1 Tax=Streptomyces sp. NPDC058045 TaxID=3346311 RepID=UPI0036E94087